MVEQFWNMLTFSNLFDILFTINKVFYTLCRGNNFVIISENALKFQQWKVNSRLSFIEQNVTFEIRDFCKIPTTAQSYFCFCSSIEGAQVTLRSLQSDILVSYARNRRVNSVYFARGLVALSEFYRPRLTCKWCAWSIVVSRFESLLPLQFISVIIPITLYLNFYCVQLFFVLVWKVNIL